MKNRVAFLFYITAFSKQKWYYNKSDKAGSK